MELEKETELGNPRGDRRLSLSDRGILPDGCERTERREERRVDSSHGMMRGRIEGDGGEKSRK